MENSRRWGEGSLSDLSVFVLLTRVHGMLVCYFFYKLVLSLGSAILIVQELCESRGGRPGLSVLTSLLVSVDVKIY